MNIKNLKSVLMIVALLSLLCCCTNNQSTKSTKSTNQSLLPNSPSLQHLDDTGNTPKHKFSVLYITNNRNEHLITIELSTPLKPELELEGLVSLQGGGQYRLEKATIGRRDYQKGLIKIHYEETGATVLSIWISPDLKDKFGRSLGKEYCEDIKQTEYHPDIDIQIEGTFLPSDSKLLLPFEAVNLAAIDIHIVQIYANNVLKFIQEVDFDSDWDIPTNGRLVYKTIYRLDKDQQRNLSTPNLYTLDLSKMFVRENGAIYRVFVSAKEAYSLYEKDYTEVSEYLDKVIAKEGNNLITEKDKLEWDNPKWYYLPEGAKYYDICNLIASDLGVIAKSADRTHWTFAISNINTTNPLEGAKIECYNYQLQHIGTTYTDTEGFASIKLSGQPFAAVVSRGKSVSYIKLLSGHEQSLSRFDVGGKKINKGLKAYIYGERGVWRPGDTLHLSMFLNETGKSLPENLPVSMELYTSQGQFHSSTMQNKSKRGLYCFSVATAASDPTGTWTANFKVADVTFTKKLIIETIKPNRLKSTLSISKPLVAGDSVDFQVNAHWLIGSPAKNLKVDVEMKLYPIAKPFNNYQGFCFTNPISKYKSSYIPLFSSRTDSLGNVSAEVNMPLALNTPGLMNAKIVTSVHEPSGGSSIKPTIVKFSPFEAYVGIKLPQTTNDNYLQTDEKYEFEVVVLNADSEPLKNRELKYSIWQIDWQWWWEKKEHSTAYYANDKHSKLINRGTLKSNSEKMVVPLKIEYPNWGRYLILVEDTKGYHKAGGIVHVDWPMWRGRSNKGDPSNITMLTFSTDKTKYKVGDNAVIYIPACKDGRALISIENGSRIISKRWISTSENSETPYKLPITSEMAPNCYIHITLLQKYASSANDLPLRMYGVRPLFVDNPDSRLEPVISVPKRIRPEEPFVVKVKESKGRPMAYTLAIVDEGLLDVTGFETPNAWNTMYTRETLGVKTWDLYDDVVGAYSGQYGPIFSVGGDQNLTESDKQDNRFKPVVKFLGPFYSEGGTHSYKITLPMYVGNVRVMVVSGANGAYGCAEKNVAVTSPLMIMSSFPRVVGCNETISLPVNIFATEGENIDAEIKISVKGAAQIKGENRRIIKLNKEQVDAIASFELVTDDKPGEIVITITGIGNGHTTKEVTILKVIDKSIDNTPRKPTIVEGSIDFESCFNFAINYPYKCSEQISSLGMTMLSCKQYLNEDQKRYIKESIPEYISLLYSRQNADGGFGYWPSKSSHEWVSSMAGHFLLMAKAEGYQVNNSVISKWEKYQNRRANNYSGTVNDQVQAYRLYTLALADKPNNGAMNRLKENNKTSANCRYILACAYAVTGKLQTAQKILNATNMKLETSDAYDMTFYSYIRDLSIASLAYSLAGNKTQAAQCTVELAQLFGNDYFITQNTAFATLAFARIAKEQVGSEKCGSVVKLQGEKSNYLSLYVTYQNQYGEELQVDSLKLGTEFFAIIKVKNNSPISGINNIALTYQMPSGYEIFNERLYGSKEYDCEYYDIRDEKVQWFFDLKRGACKEYKIRLRASYSGVFVMPSTYAEAMYSPEQYVTTPLDTTVIY